MLWATESGRLLGQRKVKDKRNEITLVPELLRALELAGGIVTADALPCQKNIAKEIKAGRRRLLASAPRQSGPGLPRNQNLSGHSDPARGKRTNRLLANPLW